MDVLKVKVERQKITPEGVFVRKYSFKQKKN